MSSQQRDETATPWEPASHWATLEIVRRDGHQRMPLLLSGDADTRGSTDVGVA